MPEIKNTFQKGIMDKDLDERIIPSGQYRDAMNIQVSTSEDSDVGTVQNILGNQRVEDIVGENYSCVGSVADEKNNVLYWFVTGPTDAIIEYNDNGTSQPIIVDQVGGVLNFDPTRLITGINIIDNLLFWTDNFNEPKKINIDTFKLNNHTNLTSHSNMFVNGVNIGLVKEDHITVIRKRPQKPPKIVFTESSIQPTFVFPANGLDGTFSTQDDMNFLNKTVGSVKANVFLETDSLVDPFDVGDFVLLSDVNATGTLPQNYQIKIEIILRHGATSSNNGYTYNIRIVEIVDNSTAAMIFTDGVPRTFNAVKLFDEKTIFEKEFIRFATRYKYEDGEYSAFSPFTQPVFLAGRFGFHPTKDPYNLGMQNNIISLSLQDLVDSDTPKDVVQIDILFKKERSTTIYSIDSIKPNDPSGVNYWNKDDYNNYTILTPNFNGNPNNIYHDTTSAYHDTYNYGVSGQYNVTTENIYAALPENQTLRPWDNVPRKALAQEITGNRIVYGNYLQNYPMVNASGGEVKPNIVIDKETRTEIQTSTYLPVTPSFQDGIGKKSIKSLRTYYLGVVYGDEYGRETPVFTSKNASISIPYDMSSGPIFKGAAETSLRLASTLYGNQPEWAHYFKYYIKQTTGEYYNLTLDRVYRNVEDESFWLSFPSSDRNKVQEGDYFTIKKQVDIESQVPEDNKIKIIDIKNEAPDEIKYNHVELGMAGRLDGYGSTTYQLLGDLFPDADARPIEGQTKLAIALNPTPNSNFNGNGGWINGANGPDLMTALTPSDKISVQFQILVGGAIKRSAKYLVAAYNQDTHNSEEVYRIVLKKPIMAKDSWVANLSQANLMNEPQKLVIKIFRIEEKSAVEFSGRFFIKTISNVFTQTYFRTSITDIYNYEVQTEFDFYNLADDPGTLSTVPGTTGQVTTEGIYSTQNTSWTNTTGNTITNTEAEWETATVFDDPNNDGSGSNKRFFLDSTGFVALANTGHVDAYDSGHMTVSDPFGGGSVTVNGFEGIIGYNDSNDHYKTTDIYTYTTGNFTSYPTGFRVIGDTVRHFDNGLTGFAAGNSAASVFSTWLYQPVDYTIPQNWAAFWASDTYFSHMSYSCPGQDLHTDSPSTWSAFESVIDSNWSTYTTKEEFVNDLFEYALEKIYASAIRVNNIPGGPSSPVNWETIQPTVSTSYDNLSTNDKQIADNCFNPGADSLQVQQILNNFNTPGNKFMINGDNTNQYEVKQTTYRNVYNHTSWNPIEVRDSSAQPSLSVLLNQEGVAKKFQLFLDYFGTNGFGTGYKTSQEYQDLKDTIVNFGKANNRRVVLIVETETDPRTTIDFPSPNVDATTGIKIQFVDDFIELDENNLPTSPAIFETEAKEDVDLNIYYEASSAIPLKLHENNENKGYLLAPIGTKVTCNANNTLLELQNQAHIGLDFHPRVKDWDGDIVEINNPGLRDWNATGDLASQDAVFRDQSIKFWRNDIDYVTAEIESVIEFTGNYVTKLKIKPHVHNKRVGLNWYNCFSFGNGVESNRIRDDFNESFILNGVKASTVLEEPYEEERRKHGLIYSGLYNSTSGVNNLNQFIQAEKITKDLMPSYGSIQKLYARDKDLVTLCEDKVLQIFVDKDALYNADGNTNLISTNQFLGQANPFRGNFGISKNPESFASESFRAYFTDKQRGAVLRLSMDGLTPISDAGMHDFFKDNLKDGSFLIGTYDSRKRDYNLTINFGTLADLVCNPDFEIGTFNQYQPLPTELALNYDFLATTPTPVNKAANDNFHMGTMNPWVASNPGSTYWDGDNAPATFTRVNIGGGINANANYTNNSSNDSSGSVKWAGQISPGYTLSQVIELPNLSVGDSVLAKWDFFNMDAGGGWSSGNKVKVTFQNANGDGFVITHSSIAFNTTPPAVSEMHCEFNKTITSGALGADSTIATGYWRIKMSLVGTSGNPWVNKSFHVDNFEVLTSESTLDNWTLNSLASNSSGTINFLNGGTAVQTGSGAHVIDLNTKYEIVLDLSSIIGAQQNAVVNVNGVNVNVDNSQPNNPTYTQSGLVSKQVYFTSPGVLDISVTGGDINISSISLKELELFGGNVDCWDMNGGANQANIYAFSDLGDGRVVFDEAPVGTYLNQATPITNQALDFTDGSKIKVSFNLDNYTGTGELKFYLYNADGEGFEHSITMSNGNKFFVGVVGAASTLPAGDSKIGKFGFEVIGTNTFSGEIDSVDLIIDGVDKGKTISYDESSKGWVSFKSFIPDYGISVTNQYYTMSSGKLWKHHVEEVDRNTFYNVHTDSSVRPILNMQPDLVKNFNTLKYEGSQSRVDKLQTHDLLPSESVAIGTNLALNQTATLSPQVTNTQLESANINNGFIISNLQGTEEDVNGVLTDLSDAVLINFDNLPSGDDYRLSFDFNVLDVDPDSHFFITLSGINAATSLSSQLYRDGHFSFDFTAGGAGTMNVVVFIQHPFVQDGYSENVNIEITNLIVQKLEVFNQNDGQYYNLHEKKGWYVDYIKTDKQEGQLNEFIEKEGKWFNYIKGNQQEVDVSAFNFQGLGIIQSVEVEED